MKSQFFLQNRRTIHHWKDYIVQNDQSVTEKSLLLAKYEHKSEPSSFSSNFNNLWQNFLEMANILTTLLYVHSIPEADNPPELTHL